MAIMTGYKVLDRPRLSYLKMITADEVGRQIVPSRVRPRMTFDERLFNSVRLWSESIGYGASHDGCLGCSNFELDLAGASLIQVGVQSRPQRSRPSPYMLEITKIVAAMTISNVAVFDLVGLYASVGQRPATIDGKREDLGQN